MLALAADAGHASATVAKSAKSALPSPGRKAICKKIILAISVAMMLPAKQSINKFMKTSQIRKIARAAGAVKFKVLKGGTMNWLACYSATAKGREEMMKKIARAGLQVEAGHYGNQVDIII
jgi:hypothetical protein